MLIGTVTDFDAAKGLGTVTDDAGTAFIFHVIEIVDGTRAVDVGQVVSFQPLAKFGRYQAGKIRKA